MLKTSKRMSERIGQSLSFRLLLLVIHTLFIAQLSAQDYFQEIVDPLPDNIGDFGQNISFYEDQLIVGSPNKAYFTERRIGYVHVYQKKEGKYELLQTIIPPVQQVGQGFGHSVKIAYGIMAVSAPTLFNTVGTGTYTRGNVFLYRKNTDALWSNFQVVGPEILQCCQTFGFSMELKDSILFVGDPYSFYYNNGQRPSRGMVHVYKQQRDTFLRIQGITDPDSSIFAFSEFISYDNRFLTIRQNDSILDYKVHPSGICEFQSKVKIDRCIRPFTHRTHDGNLYIPLHCTIGNDQSGIELENGQGVVRYKKNSQGEWEWFQNIQDPKAFYGGKFAADLAVNDSILAVVRPYRNDSVGNVYQYKKNRETDYWELHRDYQYPGWTDSLIRDVAISVSEDGDIALSKFERNVDDRSARTRIFIFRTKKEITTKSCTGFYPNPTSRNVVLPYPEKASSVCDIRGKILLNYDSRDDALLDLSHLAPDIYIVRNGECTEKIILLD